MFADATAATSSVNTGSGHGHSSDAGADDSVNVVESGPSRDGPPSPALVMTARDRRATITPLRVIEWVLIKSTVLAGFA